MKGLLIKDILNLRINLLLCGALLLLYSCLNAFSEFQYSIINYFILICSTFLITSFYLDESSKWNAFALAMPVSRKELVLSKFLLKWILHMVGFVFALIPAAIVRIFQGTLFSAVFMQEIFFIIIIVLVYNIILSASILILFKFRYAVARTISLIAACCTMGIIIGFQQAEPFSWEINSALQHHGLLMVCVGFVVSLLMEGAFYFFTLRSVQKQNFS